MIVAVFSKDDIRSKLPLDLIESLRRAAEYDPFLAERTNGKKRRHNDGWGYTVLTSNMVYEYKSLEPIYSDNKGYDQLVSILEYLGRKNSIAALLVHARLASPGYSKALNDTHPFHFYTDDNYDVWLIMNGTFTGFFTNYQDGRSDTYGLVKYLSSKDFRKIPEEILGKVVKNPEIVKHGIAIGILGINPVRDNRIIEGYFIYCRKNDKENSSDKYYDYYRLTTGKSIVFMSSTVHYYLEKKHLPINTKIENLGPTSLTNFSIDLANNTVQIDVGTS